MCIIKKWINQRKCGKTSHREGDYLVSGHNFEQIDWKVFSEYPYAINGYTQEIDYNTLPPKYWRVTIQCKYCGKKIKRYYNN